MKFINVQLVDAMNPLTTVYVGVHSSLLGLIPLCMARHTTANHHPQEDKPDVRGRERGQQGEVGSPQERQEQNLKQRKETY